MRSASSATGLPNEAVAALLLHPDQKGRFRDLEPARGWVGDTGIEPVTSSV